MSKEPRTVPKYNSGRAPPAQYALDKNAARLADEVAAINEREGRNDPSRIVRADTHSDAVRLLYKTKLQPAAQKFAEENAQARATLASKPASTVLEAQRQEAYTRLNAAQSREEKDSIREEINVIHRDMDAVRDAERRIELNNVKTRRLTIAFSAASRSPCTKHAVPPECWGLDSWYEYESIASNTVDEGLAHFAKSCIASLQRTLSNIFSKLLLVAGGWGVDTTPGSPCTELRAAAHYFLGICFLERQFGTTRHTHWLTITHAQEGNDVLDFAPPRLLAYNAKQEPIGTTLPYETTTLLELATRVAPWLKRRERRKPQPRLVLDDRDVLVTFDRSGRLVINPDAAGRFLEAAKHNLGYRCAWKHDGTPRLGCVPFANVKRHHFEHEAVVDWALRWGGRDVYAALRTALPCFSQSVAVPPMMPDLGKRSRDQPENTRGLFFTVRHEVVLRNDVEGEVFPWRSMVPRHGPGDLTGMTLSQHAPAT